MQWGNPFISFERMGAEKTKFIPVILSSADAMSNQISNLKDARILIVDDTLANIEVLENLLMMKGYTNVKSISDSTQALATIKAFEPEFILLDLTEVDLRITK
jgi:PleD family two-component response regulator